MKRDEGKKIYVVEKRLKGGIQMNETQGRQRALHISVVGSFHCKGVSGPAHSTSAISTLLI